MSLSELFPILATIVPNQFLRAVLIFVAVWIVLRIVLAFVHAKLKALFEKTETDVDDILLARLKTPLSIILYVLSFVLAISELSLGDSQVTLTHVGDSLIGIVVGYIIYVIINIAVIRGWQKFAQSTDGQADDTLVNLANNALVIVLPTLVILYILHVWGIEIGPVLAGLGIAGLAVALALQPTLANIFSGVALVAGKTFKVGDVIQLEGGQMGIVAKIGLRTTRIRTFDHEMIIIPNTKLADAIINNFYQPDKRVRVGLEFGVEYGVDPEYVKQLAIEEISKIKFIDKKEEVRVLFLNMADSALTFKAMYWVEDIADKWPAHQEGITRIYRRLYKEGIGIPFPQQTVWLRNEGDAHSPSPFDKKFKSTANKYYPRFGYPFAHEDPIQKEIDDVEKEASGKSVAAKKTVKKKTVKKKRAKK